MERDISQNAALCRSGCGFYGSSATDGLCSKCFKDAVKRKQAAPSSGPTASVAVSRSDSSSSSSLAPASVSITSTSNNTTSNNNNGLSSSSSGDGNLNNNLAASASAAIVQLTAPFSQIIPSNTEVKSEEGSKASDSSDVQAEASRTDALTKTSSSTPSTTDVVSSKPVDAGTSVDKSIEEPKSGPVKKKKTRCSVCKVSVGVMGFPCRCQGIFCSTHRYANEHNCTYDYKEHGAEEIRKNNPQIVGEKIQKI